MKNTNKVFIFSFIFLAPLFNPTKELFFNGVSLPEIIIVPWIIVCLINGFFQSFDNKNNFINGYIFAIILIVIFSTISYYINVRLNSELKNLYRIIEYVTIFIAYFFSIRNDNIQYLTWGLICTTVIVCIYTYIQFLFPEIFIFQSWSINKDITFDYNNFMFQKRMVSFFDNPLSLAAFLALILGYVHCYVKNIILQSILLIMIYIAALMTVSKSALIYVAFSVYLYYSAHIKFRKYILLSLVLTGVFLWYNIEDNNFWIERLTSEEQKEGSVNQRMYVFISSFEMIIDFPIFGIGPGNYPYIYGLSYRNANAITEEYSFTAENFFLQFYLDYGLIPFLSLFYLLFVSIYYGYQLRNNNVFFKATSISVIMYLMVGLFTSLSAASTNFILFAILGAEMKLITNYVQYTKKTLNSDN